MICEGRRRRVYVAIFVIIFTRSFAFVDEFSVHGGRIIGTSLRPRSDGGSDRKTMSGGRRRSIARPDVASHRMIEFSISNSIRHVSIPREPQRCIVVMAKRRRGWRRHPRYGDRNRERHGRVSGRSMRVVGSVSLACPAGPREVIIVRTPKYVSRSIMCGMYKINPNRDA
jgi:hypothetical protein